MPISSCSLRIGVCVWLCFTICVPHQCHCGAWVDVLGLHCFVCKRAQGRPALNDLVARGPWRPAGIPAVSKEPHAQGLSHSDGKRLDGLSLIPWQAGKPLTWEVTVMCPLAHSYGATTAREAGLVAELAAARKSAKYTNSDYYYYYYYLGRRASARFTALAPRLSG